MSYLKKLSKKSDEEENENENEGVVEDAPSMHRLDEKVVEAGFLGQDSSGRKKKIIIGGAGLILFFVVGVSAYAFWGWNKSGNFPSVSDVVTAPVQTSEEAINKEKDPAINAGEKTYPSPINGVLYTDKRSEFFKDRRPLAVVIENHVASRPPYGLADAEVVYEAVAEGGITRFVAIFLANQAPRLEPIRSVRNYFLDWSGDHDAIIVHHGGANSTDERTDALGNLERYNIDDLDCMAGGALCSRDQERFAPHNSMSDTTKLWNEASKRKINKAPKYQEWKFKNDAPEVERPASQVISYNFWDDLDYLVRWEYDPTTNLYSRFNGNLRTDKQIDANYGTQVTAKTVIVQEMGQQVVDDGTPYPHLVFDTVGTGTAKIFMDGKQIMAKWEKKDRTTKVRFYDPAGVEEIEFNRGQIWISVIPPGNLVTVN